MVLPLEVNGTVHQVEAPADTPLLWVLRDLGLTSAKYGCGADQCGSCRVLVADAPTAACRLPVGEAADRPVVTLESLAATPEGARVVDALASANAGQCGYCLPGIAVTLIHLVRRAGGADDAELLRALDPHLCRCGSQARILHVARQLVAGGS